MASVPYDVRNDSRGCFSAQFTPVESITNADMDGIAVAVANVVVQFCLRFLVTLSTEDIGPDIEASLIQFYPILLSTLLSINQQQLSLFDAQYALIISASPLTGYLVIASVCDFFGRKTKLYKRIRSHSYIIRFFGALIPFLWVGLSITLVLSSTAFEDISLYSLFIVMPFILCLAREVLQAVRDLRTRRRRKLTGLGLLSVSWHAVGRNHKCCIYLLFGYLDITWAGQVISSTAAASGKGYVLSFGQLLSIYAAVPPLVSTVSLLRVHCRDPWRMIQRLPRLCPMEVKYLLLMELVPPPPCKPSFPHAECPTLNKVCNHINTSVQSIYQSTLLSELGSSARRGYYNGGMLANPVVK